MAEPVAEPTAAVVPTLSRNDEIRGQTWALIGICGDANYEKSKNELLQALGSAYFEYILSIMPPAEPTDAPEAKPEVPQEAPHVDTPKEQLAERLFMESGQRGLDTMIEVLGPVIEKTRQSLLSLSKEPMIAFFDVSEDPETLETASASIIAKNSSFKHVDLAVVRLYSWIKLDYSPKRPKSHTSRDPKANSFYQSMTSTTTSA